MFYLIYYYDTNEFKPISEKTKKAHIDELVNLWENIANMSLGISANLKWYNYQYIGLKKIYYFI